jgi:hypothetical protein
MNQLLWWVGTAALVLTVSSAAPATGGAAGMCLPEWQSMSNGGRVPKSEPGDQYVEIAGDVRGHLWAVGRRAWVFPPPKPGIVRPLIGYWDGESWSTKAMDGLRGWSEALAIAPDGRMWAEAQHVKRGIVTGALVTGTSLADLRTVPTPSPTFVIHDLAVTSDQRVWLIGRDRGSRAAKLFVGNGGGWREIPRDQPPYLEIERGPDGRLWVIGGANQEMILRLIADRWVRTELPPLDTPYFGGLVLTHDGNALAFGSEGELFDDQRPLLLRWTGEKWVRFPTPSLKIAASITSAAANSLSDAWLLIRGSRQRKLAHWNGTSWDYQWPPHLGDLALAGTDLWLGVSRYRCG